MNHGPSDSESPLSKHPANPVAASQRGAAGHAAPEAESRFITRLLDQTAQPFGVVDFDGRFTRTNRALEDLLGYTADEMRHLSVQDLTPPAWRPVSENAFVQLKETGKAQRYEKVYRHKDGSEIPVELVTDLYLDEHGRPVGYYAFVTDVRERRAAERALRESEERFRRLYDEAPFGYHELDTEGNILSVNRTECDLLGYTQEEMIGRPIFDFVAEEECDDARAAVRHRLEQPRPVSSIERTFVTKDGQRRIFELDSRRTFNENGDVIALRSTVRDITEEIATKAALVASERRARELFEGMEDAVFVHDMQGRILDANPAASRRLGYSHEEFLSLTTHDIDQPEFAAGYQARLEQQLRDGRLQCEGLHHTKDGRQIPVDINSSTITLDDRKVVLAVIRDITDRKALDETRREFAEAQLRNAWEIESKNRALTQSEARYRQLTEGSLDAIVVADHDGRIVLFNPAAERSFGYTQAEIVGRPFIQLMPEDLRGDLITGLQDYLRSRTGRVVGHTVEMRGRRKDGEVFPLEVSLSAIEVAGELQFLAAIRDQRERQRMRAMLMQSEKLASIGLLSAGVAHEINNPLAYIANNLAVLERDLAGMMAMMAEYEESNAFLEKAAPDVLERIQSISDELDWPYVRENLGRLLTRTRDGVQRVATIVQNLRGLARTAPPKLEPVRLADLVAGALEMLQSRVRRAEIAVEVIDEGLGKIACVPSQIGQVLLNLLVNSVQAIEERGRAENNRIRVTLRESAAYQVVEIADNGCGIPSESIPRLFDPFFTTKDVGEGTGLGLSISHGIVTGHGGNIEVESNTDGSTFRIFLPRRQDSEPAQFGAIPGGEQAPAVDGLSRS